MKPLKGIRISDFTVHNAGPFCTHLLSMLGAECIKIETALRPDIFRKPHAVYGRLGPATFDQVASNKMSVRLNLKHPKGVDLAKRLAAKSDVAVESFRAGVMQRLGLGYEDLRAMKRDLVMVSVSSCGQTGPDSHFAGYAPLFGAWGGLGFLTGYRDGPPVEMRHVMDHSVGLNAALATVAALHQRRRTGEGAHVDVAAREVATSLVGEALMAAATGVSVERMGNEDYRRAPHGLYVTRQKDRWLSISIETEDQWQTLIRIMGRPELAEDTRLATPDMRHAERDWLDTIVSDWCIACNAEETAALLQRQGIAAHISWKAEDIVGDAHLRERGAILTVRETDGRERAAVGVPARFSKTVADLFDRGTPALGEHEDYVFGELLGIGRTEYAELVEDKAIY